MARISWFKSEAARYTFYGISFGFAFPILATSIDIARLDLEFSWQSIIYVQRNFPIHYIIDTAPLFLGLFAMFGGRNLDKLKEKNQQILKTSKFKQEFLANMSHEIRTPMVGVIGMIDLLFNTTKLNDLQKEYVTTIHQSSHNLLEILNQILDLSKMEEGKFDLSPTPINFKELIHQNVNLFLATATAKKINLIPKYSEKLPQNIMADGNRLTQIISNLIGNAIKFTNGGEVQIHTSTVSKKNDHLIIKVEVIDSGVGISKKDQETLFNRFSQFNEASIIAGEGSGLGLSICKKLVDLMEGKLGVKSELGKGSIFWFTFKTNTSNIPILIKENKTPKHIKNHQYNLHVLLVEDSETNILVSQQILKYLGCTADIAKTGKQAFNMFKEDNYDLILMDINLPELNGVQTCNLIREKYKKVPPIIALTSNALPGDAERFIAKGLDDYITKPFTTEILNIKLKDWFGDHYEYH
ncbi:signal transduction histidine kinase [Aquimarina sp. MAR_2010_214]|uniref:ATP-binding protein n=1 Tax=Aquimarina sp. MAR_2010_214 TaxID=1250026 RepID=UPI000C710887|nr:ATP-binding protein [Aquimarina sp. MAR_2010_214]PKV52012.1 signal transduction histidine kinase [Aquimarina sp. MAR_2010_214]